MLSLQLSPLISYFRQQTALKQLFCNLRNKRQDGSAKPLKVGNICLGVGSDESIDGIIRAFCTPGRDKILICPPAYGMYSVSADVNDVGIVKVNLDIENGFTLRPRAINDSLSNDPSIKVVFFCSPGNPAGNLLSRADIIQVLDHPSWNGVVVVDEAYIDFASVSSLAEEVNDWPNLIVIQTLSKAFGLAAIRLGVSFASLPVSRLLNNLKGPYNMSAPTIALATAALQPDSLVRVEKNMTQMVQQRDRMVEELPKIPGFGRFLGGFDTNFLLVQFLNRPADQGGVPDNGIASLLLHSFAAKANILLRYRGNEPGCVGSLRITVGTKDEVDALLRLVRSTLEEAFAK